MPFVRLWPLLALLTALIAAPHSGPLFQHLFPDLARPLYFRASFATLLLAHVELVAVSSAIAAIIGFAVGAFVTRPRGAPFRPLVDTVAAIGQTFPPVAVLAFAIPLVGYGAAPTLAALALYAVMPVLQATVTGFDAVPAAARDAAQGIGFSAARRFRAVEVPLAWPYILGGLRNAVIINIGTATIGSSVGALSLGSPIIEGLSASNPAYVLQGAVIVALLAMSAERLFDVIAPRRS